jgi:hypothetical protein
MTENFKFFHKKLSEISTLLNIIEFFLLYKPIYSSTLFFHL